MPRSTGAHVCVCVCTTQHTTHHTRHTTHHTPHTTHHTPHTQALEEDLAEFMLEMGMWVASPAELRERARDGLPVPQESDKEYCAGVKLDTALRWWGLAGAGVV